ncbi:MAG: ABC transporter permease [Candidatus Omnitrophica bacterium]|nr:ABC transporter permease [Candidatus Omnitrophota bacterium]
MKAHLFISLRYLFARRKEKFISLISVISIAGIAIGVMALIVVIAVMAGFDKDLRDKIVGNYSHITISAYRGIADKDYEGLAKKVSGHRHVKSVSPFVQGQILLKEDNRFIAVGIKGIDPDIESKVTKFSQYLVYGKAGDLGPNSIIIGKEMAYFLGIRPGDIVNAYSPLGKPYDLKVVGIFSSGMYDYDMNLVFTNIKTAQEILGMPGILSAMGVKLDNLYLADKVKKELQGKVGFDYVLKTWMDANQNFFAALKLEKFTMFIILTLIILVASFNIISTLIVMVVEKTKDIGILKALGMSSSDIRKIFTYQGLMIGSGGVIAGAFSGIGLCLLLKKYQFIKLPQDIYYLDKLPVAIDWFDIGLIVSAAMAIIIVSTIYPARRASSFKPVEALRYE